MQRLYLRIWASNETGKPHHPIQAGCQTAAEMREGFYDLQASYPAMQFITAKGKRFAVISEEDWEILIEWLETLKDLQIVRQAVAELKAAGGDRKKAGWMEWQGASLAH